MFPPNTGIATRAELEALEATHEKPEPTMELKPDWAITGEVHNAVRQWRIDRIAHLTERLDVAKERFEHNIDRSFDITD